MRWIIYGLALVSLLVPGVVSAHCGVTCHRFVETVVALPVNVPVATYYPITYEYIPTPNVTVQITAEAIKQLQTAPQTTPPVPPSPTPGKVLAKPPASASSEPLQTAPQAGPAVFASRCLKCHSSADASIGKPLLSGVLSCETKLNCIKAVVDGAMPKDGKLTADEAGDLITELTR